MSRFEQFASVRLKRSRDGVEAGRVGTVVDVYERPTEAYEVEFADDGADGRSLKVFAVRAEDLDPAPPSE